MADSGQPNYEPAGLNPGHGRCIGMSQVTRGKYGSLAQARLNNSSNWRVAASGSSAFVTALATHAESAPA